MDLAESLDYATIYIVSVSDKARIVAVRKFNDVLYPQLEAFVIRKCVPRYPPSIICVDYTNERSFSEWLESALNPSFLNPYAPNFKKWKYVDPISFNDTTKLDMKQNMRQLEIDGLFEWPKQEKTDPRTWALIKETKEQMYREMGEPSRGNAPLKFPKPKGQHNDLIIGLELSLYRARRFLTHFHGANEKPLLFGRRIYEGDKKPEVTRLEKATIVRLKGFNIDKLDVTLPK